MNTGTTAYSAPEMHTVELRQRGTYYDRRVDLYALGLVLIEMFLGQVSRLRYSFSESRADPGVTALVHGHQGR